MSMLLANPEGAVEMLPRKEHGGWVDNLSAVLAFAVSLALFATPLRHSGNLLPYAQDDLYYYLVVARNLAHGLGSTFDGVTPTNGYHPLYMLLLWAASKRSTSLLFSFQFLWLLDVVAAMGTFLAVRSVFARAFANRWLTNGFAFVVLWMSFYRFYHQMEVTLVLPLGFVLLLLLDCAPAMMTARRWAAVGLIASLVILSRLDAGLLVALCGFGVLLQREYRKTLTVQKIAGFLAGCLPLLIAYFWANAHFFGRLMPISGAAKQTRTGHGFAWMALRLSLSHGTELMFLLSFIALCWLSFRYRRLKPEHRLICAAGLLFPFVHWGTNLLLSDWMLWSWYKYSLTFSIAMLLLLAGIAIADRSPASAHGVGSIVSPIVGPAVFAVGLLLVFSSRYRPDPMMVDVADGAKFLQAFAKDHPGRYAMGDRAGMVGYMLGQPMLQTEGLMMDTAFLNHIRRREPLLAVLQAYRVDYYVGFEPVEHKGTEANGCFTAVEPAQAGPQSAVMTSTLCDRPVAEFGASSGRTLIFDLRP